MGTSAAKPSSSFATATTKQYDTETMIKLLINGYLRLIENKFCLSYAFPSGLIDVIWLFYPRDFKFIDKNLKEFKISDDGLTIEKSGKQCYATIQFGEFFTSKSSLIYRYTLKQTSGQSGFNGFGFITKDYKEFLMSDWNEGDNDSMIFYTNGYFVTSDRFDKKMKDHGEYKEEEWFCVELV